MRRSFFITLEGPEGSGKSSQARWLAQALRRTGKRVVELRDPGSTSLGRALRRVLLHSRQVMSPMTEALLFIGGRVQLVEEKIRPALAGGRVVLCDRFHDSTVAYQGFGGGLDAAWLDRTGRRAIGGAMPELTLLLDVPVSVGFHRLRRAHDRMEQKAMAFHRRVRQGFLALASQEPKRFVIIDASRSAGEVRRRVEQAVMQRVR